MARSEEIDSAGVLHFSGIPATGKSSFSRFLASKHGFAHYDLECFPRGWPVPSLYALWCTRPLDFVKQLQAVHERAIIDWGFPIECLPLVTQFSACGIRLIWFNGDITHARRLFLERGGLDPARFDHQVSEIQRVGLPAGIEATVVDALTAAGEVRPMQELYAAVFGGRGE